LFFWVPVITQEELDLNGGGFDEDVFLEKLKNAGSNLSA
jgi:hypothetical protein